MTTVEAMENIEQETSMDTNEPTGSEKTTLEEPEVNEHEFHEYLGKRRVLSEEDVAGSPALKQLLGGVEPKSVSRTDESEDQNLVMLHVDRLPYQTFPWMNSVAPEKVRGWIWIKDRDVVIPSLPHTLELSASDFETHQETILQSLRSQGGIGEDPLSDAQMKYYYSVEGTVLRLVYLQGRWQVVTNKRLNAFQSRWSSRFSFGNMFAHALVNIMGQKLLDSSSATTHAGYEQREVAVLSKFFEELDHNRVYFILVRPNQENRIVCRAPIRTELHERILFLGSLHWRDIERFSKDGTSPFQKFSEEEHNPVLALLQRPRTVSFSDSNQPIAFHELGTWVKRSINILEHQGILAIHLPTQCAFRIVPDEYKAAHLLRGTNPNLHLRYFEIRNDPEKVNAFCEQYDKQAPLFDDYEIATFLVARHLASLYVQRYIKNRYVALPKEEYYLLKKCHMWYLEDRVYHKVHTRTILRLLNKEPPIVVFRLARKHLQQADLTSSYGSYGQYAEEDHHKLGDADNQGKPAGPRSSNVNGYANGYRGGSNTSSHSTRWRGPRPSFPVQYRPSAPSNRFGPGGNNNAKESGSPQEETVRGRSYAQALRTAEVS